MAAEALVLQVIEEIAQTLNCSQRVVANLMGVTPHTLSNNRDKPLSELTPRTLNRLLPLYRIVVDMLGTHRPEMIYDVLNLHVFADRKGRKDSVVSALQQEKYESEMLEQIAALALTQYEEKRRAKLIELPDVKSATA
jgi:hypothetical protein